MAEPKQPPWAKVTLADLALPISGNALVVLLLLRIKCWKRPRILSNQTIHEAIPSLGKRAIVTALDELMAAKLVTVTKHPGNQRSYGLVVPQEHNPEKCSESITPEEHNRSAATREQKCCRSTSEVPQRENRSAATREQKCSDSTSQGVSRSEVDGSREAGRQAIDSETASLRDQAAGRLPSARSPEPLTADNILHLMMDDEPVEPNATVTIQGSRVQIPRSLWAEAIKAAGDERRLMALVAERAERGEVKSWPTILRRMLNAKEIKPETSAAGSGDSRRHLWRS